MSFPRPCSGQDGHPGPGPRARGGRVFTEGPFEEEAMRRQNDEQLRCWAREISQRLMQDGWPAAYLIYHGSPGSGGPSSAHAENSENIHILAMQDIGVGDLSRLQELLPEEGVGDVTVK